MHVEGYARTAGKGKAGGHTVDSIAAEADRHAGACPHITAPAAPVLLFGVSPSEAAAQAKAWADKATDARGHKLRKDGLCLLAGVTSVPPHFTDKDWNAFKKQSLAWMKSEYGKRLVSVVEHTDEQYRHLHFYAVPLEGERFDSLHDGFKAQNEANKSRGSRKATKEEKKLDLKAGRLAYGDAMGKFQDRFYSAVGRRFGMARIGPKRRRMSRPEWHAQKAQLRADKERMDALEAQQEQIKVHLAGLEKHKALLGKQLELTTKERQSLEKLQREQPLNDAILRELLKNVPEADLPKAWEKFREVASQLSRPDRFPPGLVRPVKSKQKTEPERER